MQKITAPYGLIILASLIICSCNNEQHIKEHIKANRTLLAKKQSELSDLNYKVTSNSLHIGTNSYDSTIGKDFNVRSGIMQASIDSLKAETDSLQQLIGK